MASKTEELPSENEPLVHYGTPGPRLMSRRRCLWISLLAVIIIILAAALVIGLGVGLGARRSSALYKSVKASNLVDHLKELESIAADNEQSRAVQYGYNDSAEWVIGKLMDAGYTNITRQEFTIGSFELFDGNSLSVQFSGITLNYTLGSQFSVMRYSGSTNGVTESGSLSTVSNSGCDASDYSQGTIALLNYNSNSTDAGCTIYEMVSSAMSADVTALIMMRTQDDPFSSFPPNARIYNQTVDEFGTLELPVMGVTYQVGQTLLDILEQNPTLMVSTNTSTTLWLTYNVLAYTLDGRADSIIVVGSHLDSVPGGPGINDNGSGSMANLEMAIQLAKSSKKPLNKVLFAFWGAEELGLLGSTHFVQRLTQEDTISDIALNLNFDMIGSPNYVRQVYNGSGAENEKVVSGSAKIQALFEEFFESQDLPHVLTPFNGRSDYGPFIAQGTDIPAGGLATGADEVKTVEERNVYGGLANAILDPCYHQACDTVDNIDQEVYEQMSQCATYVLEELMMKEDLRGFLDN